jgi:hypothetical protein
VWSLQPAEPLVIDNPYYHAAQAARLVSSSEKE